MIVFYLPFSMQLHKTIRNGRLNASGKPGKLEVAVMHLHKRYSPFIKW